MSAQAATKQATASPWPRADVPISITEVFTIGNAFRKIYISAIVDRVEVDDGQVRIVGRKEVLEQAVRAIGAVGHGVRSFVPKWRPVGAPYSHSSSFADTRVSYAFLRSSAC